MMNVGRCGKVENSLTVVTKSLIPRVSVTAANSHIVTSSLMKILR